MDIKLIPNEPDEIRHIDEGLQKFARKVADILHLTSEIVYVDSTIHGIILMFGTCSNRFGPEISRFVEDPRFRWVESDSISPTYASTKIGVKFSNEVSK